MRLALTQMARQFGADNNDHSWRATSRRFLNLDSACTLGHYEAQVIVNNAL